MIVEVTIENKTYRVPAQWVQGKLWYHFEGLTRIFEPNNNSFSGGSSSKAGSKEITSPMPGKITKLLKTKADQVKAGEVVIVMEAMKMEYTLKASQDGVLKEISIKVGDQVTVGKVLAVFQ